MSISKIAFKLDKELGYFSCLVHSEEEARIEERKVLNKILSLNSELQKKIINQSK